MRCFFQPELSCFVPLLIFFRPIYLFFCTPPRPLYAVSIICPKSTDQCFGLGERLASLHDNYFPFLERTHGRMVADVFAGTVAIQLYQVRRCCWLGGLMEEGESQLSPKLRQLVW